MGGVIRATIRVSNFPPSSDFRSSTKSWERQRDSAQQGRITKQHTNKLISTQSQTTWNMGNAGTTGMQRVLLSVNAAQRMGETHYKTSWTLCLDFTLFAIRVEGTSHQHDLWPIFFCFSCTCREWEIPPGTSTWCLTCQPAPTASANASWFNN